MNMFLPCLIINDDVRMYDLFGREIKKTEPGTIYIQAGRKRVAAKAFF